MKPGGRQCNNDTQKARAAAQARMALHLLTQAVWARPCNTCGPSCAPAFANADALCRLTVPTPANLGGKDSLTRPKMDCPKLDWPKLVSSRGEEGSGAQGERLGGPVRAGEGPARGGEDRRAWGRGDGGLGVRRARGGERGVLREGCPARKGGGRGVRRAKGGGREGPAGKGRGGEVKANFGQSIGPIHFGPIHFGPTMEVNGLGVTYLGQVPLRPISFCTCSIHNLSVFVSIHPKHKHTQHTQTHTTHHNTRSGLR